MRPVRINILHVRVELRERKVDPNLRFRIETGCFQIEESDIVCHGVYNTVWERP